MFQSSYGQSLPDSMHSLIEDLKSSDPSTCKEAFGRFATVYFDPLVAFVMRKIGRHKREEAKDIVSDFIFRRLIEKRIVDKFEPFYGGKKRKFRHFLCRNLEWLCLDHHKKQPPAEYSYDDQPAEESGGDSDEAIFEYVLAANLLIHVFQEVKADCLKKDQLDMWNVFKIRIIQGALDGKKEKHSEIAKRLNLGNARRSRNLLESGQQKFRSFACRIVREVDHDSDPRTPEELLAILAQPPIANIDLFEHLEKAIETSPDEEVFHFKTGEELSLAAISWMQDDIEDTPYDEDVLWRELLNQAVSEYEVQGTRELEASFSFSAIMSTSEQSLADALFMPTKSVDALRGIRVSARSAYRASESKLESAMHRTIYALVHAADIICHGTCASKRSEQRLTSVFDSSLANVWLDEQSRWQLEEAKRRIAKGVSFPRGN